MEKSYHEVEVVREQQVDDRCDWDDYEPVHECHMCNGRGHNIEGRTCPYCEGSGRSDF